MSSLYSDPPFPRGSTLLAGETIESDAIGPIAGRDIVGQVKVFQDTDPFSGTEYSNRLTVCVAVRWTGSAGGIVAGDVVKFTAAALLTESDAKGSTTAGTIFGVVDEYIPSTTSIRTNDIIWVVVRGPATAKFAATGVTAGSAIYIGTAGVFSGTASGGILGHAMAASATAGSRVLLAGPNIGV
jgi:hypothetical protein